LIAIQRQIIAKLGKKVEERPIIGRFPQNRLLFKLPSAPQQAYSVALNLPVAGTGLLALFSDPAETTDG
jgi:hypothetical protein